MYVVFLFGFILLCIESEKWARFGDCLGLEPGLIFGIRGDLGRLEPAFFFLLCACTTIFWDLWLMMSLNRQAVLVALVLG